MTDKIIVEFLANKFYKTEFEKQTKALEKATKDENQEAIKNANFELGIVNKEANSKLQDWLLNSSKRANQLSLTTHPPKFSHPDAKIDAIIAKHEQDNDGLLRSGNVEIDLDVMGNAASFDVDKFLRLEMENHLTILQNLEQNTSYIKEQFDTKDFDAIRNNFLKIKKSTPSNKSSHRLKQVYFPIENDYHLLSLLTPSGIIYKLKQKINDTLQPFSKSNKKAKEDIAKAVKDKTKQEYELNNIWDLTAIGYGGTKPQNISVLNNKNGGVSYLLSSMPPILKKRKTQPPKKDFFSTNIWLNDYLKDDFKYLKKVLNNGRKNKKTRDKRDDIIVANIMHQVKRNIDNIREIDSGWSNSKTYGKLPKWQKILLDNEYENIRDDKELNHDFLNNARLEFAIWFNKTYNNLFDTNLGDIEISYIEGLLKDEMELFR